MNLGFHQGDLSPTPHITKQRFTTTWQWQKFWISKSIELLKQMRVLALY